VAFLNAFKLFQCLIAGLITVCPEDPFSWMIESIQQIEEKEISNVAWYVSLLVFSLLHLYELCLIGH